MSAAVGCHLEQTVGQVLSVRRLVERVVEFLHVSVAEGRYAKRVGSVVVWIEEVVDVGVVRVDRVRLFLALVIACFRVPLIGCERVGAISSWFPSRSCPHSV